jgi:bifunctional non-homologous end joining protein LigD
VNGITVNADLIQPMLATLGTPPTRFADFAVEAKYDGQRGMAVVDHGTVTLLSRNGADITRTFPEITAALPQALCNRSAVLDGEIVALDEAGVPSFSRLQQRWPQNRRPSAELLRRVPVRFYVFDVLSIDGRDVTRQPYADRRGHLTDIATSASGRIVQFPANWTHTDPQIVLAASAELGLEGIVCKDMDSRYTSGLRSRDWIKTPHRQTSSFVIGGWLPGMGPNSRTVGALLLGAYMHNQLVFCGVVGAGLSEAERRRLTEALKPLHCNPSPFAHVDSDIAPYARWVHPVLAGDVEYRQFHRSLRHPSWKGLRSDVECRLVTLSQPA